MKRAESLRKLWALKTPAPGSTCLCPAESGSRSLAPGAAGVAGGFPPELKATPRVGVRLLGGLSVPPVSSPTSLDKNDLPRKLGFFMTNDF